MSMGSIPVLVVFLGKLFLLLLLMMMMMKFLCNVAVNF
jgi:hypothetical protein